MSEERRMNPSIKNICYGKKEIKEITIYPLSIGDQFTITDLITQVVQELVQKSKTEGASDFVFMTSIMEAIETNIDTVLCLIADISEEESKIILKDMTNDQLVDLVDLIWSVNFEPALKKGKSLFERAKGVFSSRRLSADSSNSILNTDSKTSTENHIKTEE